VKKVILFLAICFTSQQLLAQKNKPAKVPSTQQTMSSFLEHVLGLKKYLSSDEEFKNTKNASDIEGHLKGLAAKVKEVSHDPVMTSENFKFSRKVLEDHVVETERVFRLGNKSYARWMANSTLSICMSCHMQLPTQSRKMKDLTEPRRFKSDFEYADFLFSTRDFVGAHKIFEKLISGFPQTQVTADQVETAIQREVGYFTRILRSPQQGVDALSKYLLNASLSEFDRSTLNGHLEQFRKWRKIKLPDPNTATAAEVISFVKKHIGKNENQKIEEADPWYIPYLFVSGILYEYLNKHPRTSDTPEILYWLAKCDHATNNFFYSLGDLYLRECIIEFPSSAVASKCFKDYEQNITLGYTGSSGTNIPSDVKEELRRLKSYVDKKGKVEIKGGHP